MKKKNEAKRPLEKKTRQSKRREPILQEGETVRVEDLLPPREVDEEGEGPKGLSYIKTTLESGKKSAYRGRRGKKKESDKTHVLSRGKHQTNERVTGKRDAC